MRFSNDARVGLIEAAQRPDGSLDSRGVIPGSGGRSEPANAMIRSLMMRRRRIQRDSIIERYRVAA